MIDRADLLILAAPSIDGWAGKFAPEKTFMLSDLIPDTLRLAAGPDLNPHFWTDPVILRLILPSVVEYFCKNDESNCLDYRNNADQLSGQLELLDMSLRGRLSNIKARCVVSAEPFFEYFLRRYNVFSVGSIEGIPGQSGSPRRVSRLLSSATLNQCFAVLSQRSSPNRIATMFSTESGIPIVYLDIIAADENASTVQIISENADRLMNQIK